MSLREVRKNERMSQHELAIMAGVKQPLVSKIECGKARPSPEIAKRIANVLHLTTEQMWEMFYADTDNEPCNG